MSICNVWLNSERALVAVDTEVRQAGRGRHEQSKMIPLVHANLVLAGRGVMSFLTVVSSICHENGFDLDSIEDQMIEILKLGHDRLVEVARALAIQDPTIQAQEIVLVGWSGRASRMVGSTYRRQSATTEFERLPIDQWRIHGGEESWGAPPAPEPNSPEAMEQIARWQVRNFRAQDPNAAVGGRLLIAELTPNCLKVTSRCRLD